MVTPPGLSSRRTRFVCESRRLSSNQFWFCQWSLSPSAWPSHATGSVLLDHVPETRLLTSLLWFSCSSKDQPRTQNEIRYRRLFWESRRSPCRHVGMEQESLFGWSNTSRQSLVWKAQWWQEDIEPPILLYLAMKRQDAICCIPIPLCSSSSLVKTKAPLLCQLLICMSNIIYQQNNRAQAAVDVDTFSPITNTTLCEGPTEIMVLLLLLFSYQWV